MVYFISADYNKNGKLTTISTYVKALDIDDGVKEFYKYLRRNEYPEWKYHPQHITFTKVNM